MGSAAEHMERKAAGRDWTLSVRMAVALALIAVVYVAGEVLFVALGVSAYREGNRGALAGAVMFAVAIPVLVLAQIRKSGDLALHLVRAEVLSPGADPRLEEIAARVAAMAGLPTSRVALIRSSDLNALSVGRSPSDAVVAVTTGLLRALTTQELEAVFAHELAHVANRDGVVMTIVSGPAMVGSYLWHDDDFRGKVFLVVLYWPVFVLGLLLMRTVSRYREFVADRGAALITGAPEQLMSTLVKIAGKQPRGDLRGGAAVSALCLVGHRPGRIALLADHPPIEKRLRRLEKFATELGRARD